MNGLNGEEKNQRKQSPVPRRERNEDKMLLHPNWENTTEWQHRKINGRPVRNGVV